MTLFNVKPKHDNILRRLITISPLCGVILIGTISTAFANTSGGVFSRCELAISEVSQHAHNKYDPLSNQDYVQTIELRIRNVGAKKCKGSLTFDTGAGTGKLQGSSGESLEYILLDEYNLRKVLFNPDRQAQNSVSLNLNPGRSTQFNPRLYISRSQSAASGKYETSIDAIYQSYGDLRQTRKAFHFGTHVGASVQANWVGVDRLGNNGHYGAVKLGELKPGLRRNLGLQLRSNSDVDVSISSQNQGSLANKSLSNTSIDYDFSIGGHNIDLSTTDDVLLPADLSRNGVTNSIEIALSDFSNVPAGRYGDVIHVRVAAR